MKRGRNLWRETTWSQKNIYECEGKEWRWSWFFKTRCFVNFCFFNQNIYNLFKILISYPFSFLRHTQFQDIFWPASVVKYDCYCFLMIRLSIKKRNLELIHAYWFSLSFNFMLLTSWQILIQVRYSKKKLPMS